MKYFHLIFFSVLSGILLSLPFLEMASPVVMFVAFVPLFIACDKLLENTRIDWRALFLLIFIGLLLWNALTTWWIINATVVFGIIAFVANALLMTAVFVVIYRLSVYIGAKSLPLVFIMVWIAFEYFYFNAEISWPWLTLGNAFSTDIRFVQWYEYTGVLGGSVWILLVNFLLYASYKYYKKHRINVALAQITIALIIVLLPGFWSYFRYKNYRETGEKHKFCVIQPNIDPYNEKFNGMSVDNQMAKMLHLANQTADSSTHFIVFPETALPDGIWEEQLHYSDEYFKLKEFLDKKPGSEIIIGASTARIVPAGIKVPPTARRFSDANHYYERFNTALFIDRTTDVQIYHKSKLVVGVEKMPYPKFFRFLENFALDLGGTVGSLGIQDKQIPFVSHKHQVKIGVAICYESVYGEFVGNYIKNGADYLVIITNDGWWGNTPGHRQHKMYAGLRAVETRRSIARSANTGISCFVNQRGDILQPTAYWKEAAISGELAANNKITVYVKYGDYLGRMASFACVLILLAVFYKFIYTRLKKKDNFKQA